jgi:hypothetical protein
MNAPPVAPEARAATMLLHCMRGAVPPSVTVFRREFSDLMDHTVPGWTGDPDFLPRVIAAVRDHANHEDGRIRELAEPVGELLDAIAATDGHARDDDDDDAFHTPRDRMLPEPKQPKAPTKRPARIALDDVFHATAVE